MSEVDRAIHDLFMGSPLAGVIWRVRAGHAVVARANRSAPEFLGARLASGDPLVWIDWLASAGLYRAMADVLGSPPGKAQFVALHPELGWTRTLIEAVGGEYVSTLTQPSAQDAAMSEERRRLRAVRLASHAVYGEGLAGLAALQERLR